jgi:hypothetical protein
MKQAYVRPKKCMVPTCPNTPNASRGLCHACYKRAQILVAEGKTSWQELIDNGRCQPARRAATDDPTMFGWFLPNAPQQPPKHKILPPEQEELLDALTDPSEDAEEHMRTIILDKIRDMMETYGLTTTNTIGKLIARMEEQVTR